MYKYGLILSFYLLLPVAFAAAPPPLEAYGLLPKISLVSISPSGDRIAFRKVDGEQDVVFVADVNEMAILATIDVEKVKPRSLRFISDNYLVLAASTTVNPYGVRKQFESSAAWLLDVSRGKIRSLLQRDKDLYPAQEGLGRVIGQGAGGHSVLMPAFVGSVSMAPQYSLYEVAANKVRNRIVGRGLSTTIDWFVDADGEPLVREDFDNKKNLHNIWSFSDGERQLLYTRDTDRPRINLVGLTPDYQQLIFSARTRAAEAPVFYGMSVADGTISEEILGDHTKDVSRPLLDVNRVMYGVEFDGFSPSYEFFDERMTARVAQIQSALQGVSAKLIGWSGDFKRLVFFVSGSWTAGAYLMFTAGETEARLLGQQRDTIRQEDIAQVVIDSYPARDGLQIPALITARNEVAATGHAPLIVIPHGGPASHDRFGFDWMAQYFASRGYVVLQPQFRGSDGFGASFELAGNGEWGGKMQTDLDDGVLYLIDKGMVDPARVCIVGASYGGYAALAAGAFSPDMYKCHVSINGVSDLRKMLNDARRDHGNDHWIVGYWEDWYGATAKEREAIDALSPTSHAESFRAPVLLIHGRDDTVVPIGQSKRMRKALRRAKRDVEFVQLKGEDHWLSSEETRVELLRIIAEFIEEHL